MRSNSFSSILDIEIILSLIIITEKKIKNRDKKIKYGKQNFQYGNSKINLREVKNHLQGNYIFINLQCQNIIIIMKVSGLLQIADIELIYIEATYLGKIRKNNNLHYSINYIQFGIKSISCKKQLKGSILKKYFILISSISWLFLLESAILHLVQSLPPLF